MTISIDWGTKVINVPKVDMTLIQSDPFEIREMSLNTFRLALKALEAGDNGMAFPDTHYHNPPVTVGGVTLARVIALINEYTVTFEDGQYAVNLVGANSNVADRVNLNQVSVRPANSAGLIQTREIEHASFNDVITVDVINGVAGTLYPTGTQVRPVNNIPDALLIDAVRGFNVLAILGSITLDTGDDVRGLRLCGETMHKTVIVMNPGAQTEGVELAHTSVSGIADGEIDLVDCLVGNLSGVHGHFHDCMLAGTIVLNGSEPTQFIKCVDALPGAGVPVIDLGGSGRDLGVWGYHGGLKLINKTGEDKVSVNMDSGRLILDSSIENGQILVKGTGLCRPGIEDNHSGTAVVDTDGLVNPAAVADAVVDEDLSGHSPPQSLAAYVKRTAGLLGEYRRIKNIARDPNGDLETAEVHIYANEGDYDNEENATIYDADATFVAKLLTELGMKPR